MSGPQYAITHTRTLEYIVVTKGTGTLVTGGSLIPPTIDTDPYPSSDPNATIRSAVGVAGGLARRVGPGDVIVNLPGTPHWLSQIDGTIEYVEIAVANVDPAPGIERAEVRPPPGRRPDIFRATGARRPARLLQNPPMKISRRDALKVAAAVPTPPAKGPPSLPPIVNNGGVRLYRTAT